MKRVLSSLLPLSWKKAVYGRLSRAKIQRLRQAKTRFRTARRKGARPPLTIPQGVNLVGYIRADMGLGAAARGIAASLDHAGIPFNVVSLECGNDSSHTDLSWSHKEVSRSRFDVTIVCVNPDNSFYLRTEVPREILGDRYVIANWYWELPEIPDQWTAEFEYTDEVWAASRFICDAVSAKARVPVIRMPPVVQLTAGQRSSRRELGLPERCFLFLAMFDTKSILERKNPLGVLRAFQNAFGSCEMHAGLVMKFNNPDDGQPIMRELRRQVAAADNVWLLDRLLTRAELTSLIDVCDGFVSLHRAEGFGLGPAEAMSLGKPAIITKWSGNTDYMTNDNCIGIDYELVKLGQDYGPYKADQHWAEPDLAQAAYWMKRLVAEPALAAKIGSRGRGTIRSGFSPQAVGKLIHARLQEIRNAKS